MTEQVMLLKFALVLNVNAQWVPRYNGHADVIWRWLLKSCPCPYTAHTWCRAQDVCLHQPLNVFLSLSCWVKALRCPIVCWVRSPDLTQGFYQLCSRRLVPMWPQAPLRCSFTSVLFSVSLKPCAVCLLASVCHLCHCCNRLRGLVRLVPTPYTYFVVYLPEPPAGLWGPGEG